MQDLMEPLAGKNILLIVTGSIAAYKSALLTRLLVKAGAHVKIVMTPAATAFITPLTLSTLSGNPVLIEMMEQGEWNSHVNLGLWADLVLVAPATANTMAKMASGQADNLALTSYLSAKCPVMIAPAMDLDMWKHPATRKNVTVLQSYGNELIPVGDGELASGLSGEGRMAEPEEIVDRIKAFFSKKKKELTGKNILITAGPTFESIDPVRFIGNNSSGKMGVAIAENCVERGAEVKLILGPSSVVPSTSIQTIRVRSAAEMADSSLAFHEWADIVVLAAAVADYTPEETAMYKIKKSDEVLTLRLKRTTDIAEWFGSHKRPGQLLVGFALETQNGVENAKKKLEKKHFDFIVLNSLEDEGAGFQHDTNKITLIFPNNKIKEFQLKSKVNVAEDIVTEIVHLS